MPVHANASTKTVAAANVIVAPSRFPTVEEMRQTIEENEVDFIGCHIGHQIPEEIVSLPSVKAVSTSNVGWNHIFAHPGVIVTNTPGDLAGATAIFGLDICPNKFC